MSLESVNSQIYLHFDCLAVTFSQLKNFNNNNNSNNNNNNNKKKNKNKKNKGNNINNKQLTHP